MITVTKEAAIGSNEAGHNITEWANHSMLSNYVLTLAEGEYGWIRVDHVSLHFKVRADGPEFTNGRFDDGDRAWLERKIGKELTDVMLRNR